MHTVMIMMALLGAFLIRWSWSPHSSNYTQHWQQTLFYFLFPPLLLLMTAMAVLGMGNQGKMLGLETGWLSYALALLFLLAAIALLLWQFYQQAKLCNHCFSQQQNLTTIGNTTAYLLPTDLPYSAEIGWWNSQLVMSAGLVTLLDQPHLEAVIAHEQAHVYYRDTFWFFWLGWLYRTTAWLPHSHDLWEELLLLRELRADCKARQTIDPLLLAESLVTVAKFTVKYPTVGCAALSCNGTKTRLEQRIEALINQEEITTPPLINIGRELMWALMPLVTMPWHHCGS